MIYGGAGLRRIMSLHKRMHTPSLTFFLLISLQVRSKREFQAPVLPRLDGLAPWLLLWVNEYFIVHSIKGLSLCFSENRRWKSNVNINNNIRKIQLWEIDFTSSSTSRYVWCALAWMSRGNSGLKDKGNICVLFWMDCERMWGHISLVI